VSHILLLGAHAGVAEARPDAEALVQKYVGVVELEIQSRLVAFVVVRPVNFLEREGILW
jgi:hypothetical protein